ncbi:MAG: hypothetical protein ABI425_02775 [Patescibacteria group bacterium]
MENPAQLPTNDLTAHFSDEPVQTPMISVPPSQPVAKTQSKSNALYLFIGVLLLVAVGAGGYALGQMYPMTPKTVNQITVSPTEVPLSPMPTMTIDPLGGWRLVQNYNWSFKVPNDWHYLLCDSGVASTFVGPSILADTTVSCAFDTAPGSISVQKVADPKVVTIPDTTSTSPVVQNRKNVTVAGFPAIQQQETISDGPGLGSKIVVYITKSEELYIVTLSDLKYLLEFDQILSTFNFTYQTSVGEATPSATPAL